MSHLISAAELKQKDLSELIILDCRSDLADRENGYRLYLSNHISGALHAHLENDLSGPIVPSQTGRHPLPTAEKFATTVRNWGITNDSQVVVYDQNNSMFAARAWWMLRWIGIEHVKVIDGGFDAWLAANGDCENGEAPSLSPSNFNVSSFKDQIVSAEQLLAGTGELTILDARALPRYLGETEPLDIKAGHIPSALNAEFTKNLNPDGTFLDKNKLKERFTSIKDKTVVCYCGSGVTACHNILAIAESGYSEPKLYPGSWSEWITDDSRPISTTLEGTPL